MPELTVGAFLSQLGDKGFPVKLDSLTDAVEVADKVIGRAEISQDGWCRIWLVDDTKLLIKLDGVEVPNA